MDFRKTIKDELTRRGMTQSRLAELADMMIPRVSDYLRGKRDVYGETLERMLKALNLKITTRSIARKRKGK